MNDLDGIVNEARELQGRGEHATAIERFTAILGTTIIQAGETHPDRATLLNDRAFSHTMVGSKDHYDAAFADNQAALAHARDPDQKARALIDMSYIQRVGYNNVPAARNSLQLAAELATPNSFFQAKALEFEGRTYQGTKEFDRMILLYDHAAAIYRTLATDKPEDKTLKARLGDTAHLLGVVYLDQGNFEKALLCQEESLHRHREIGNKIGVYLATRTIGRIEYQRGNPHLALEWYTHAVEALGDNPPGRNRGSLALNQAQAYFAVGNEPKAIECWELFSQNVLNGSVTPHDLQQLRPAVEDVLTQARTRGITLPHAPTGRMVF